MGWFTIIAILGKVLPLLKILEKVAEDPHAKKVMEMLEAKFTSHEAIKLPELIDEARKAYDDVHGSVTESQEPAQ